MINCGESLLDSVLVLSVEVCPSQVTPGVAHNHAVRVEHRDNLEDVMFPQGYCDLGVSCQILIDSDNGRPLSLPVI